MIKERDVEKRLVEKVVNIGGMTRKLKWIGCIGAPDRIVFYKGRTYFVELKRPGGVCSTPQLREHQRMTDHGVRVYVLRDYKEVDDFVGSIAV